MKFCLIYLFRYFHFFQFSHKQAHGMNKRQTWPSLPMHGKYIVGVLNYAAELLTIFDSQCPHYTLLKYFPLVFKTFEYFTWITFKFIKP